MPTTVGDLAALVRSKNASPFWLTIDIMFEDDASYETVRDADVVTADRMAEIFRLPATDVKVFHHDRARALKVSFPRAVSSGSARDNDAFGGQQYAPILDLVVDPR